MGIPEKDMIVSVGDKLISAKPLFDALRYIRDKLALAAMGIEYITPSDKFVIHFFGHHTHSGNGTHTGFPKDILAFQRQCWEAIEKDKAKERDSNGQAKSK